ncbi:MAG: hypothetical protein LBL58_16580 [Tannerellaceae bacterium]|jgi:hypothetical protein|nr:hypothetical protein [Tannerellaceae bacterium]
MNQVYNLLIVGVILLAVSCTGDSGDSGNMGYDGGGFSEGKSGSMARFCIAGDVLFTVDNSSLKTFDISDPKNPVFYKDRTQNLGFGIETIFPMDSLLFIGSQTGMHIYHISNRQIPQYLSTATHILSCDPVVAQGNYAYVTLNSNNIWCGRNTNVLQIYDITDLKNPEFVKEISVGFTSPMGLGIDGNKLFICDKGLRVYDITDGKSPVWIDDLHSAGVHDIGDSYDVIPINGRLILVASSGIYQLDYTGESLNLLSKIEITRGN